MKKLFYVLFIVAVTLLGLTFTYKNHQTVQIEYYFGISFSVELSVLLFVTFAVGLICGYLVTLLSNMRARRRLSQARKEIRTLQRADT